MATHRLLGRRLRPVAGRAASARPATLPSGGSPASRSGRCRSVHRGMPELVAHVVQWDAVLEEARAGGPSQIVKGKIHDTRPTAGATPCGFHAVDPLADLVAKHVGRRGQRVAVRIEPSRGEQRRQRDADRRRVPARFFVRSPRNANHVGVSPSYSTSAHVSWTIRCSTCSGSRIIWRPSSGRGTWSRSFRRRCPPRAPERQSHAAHRPVPPDATTASQQPRQIGRVS